MRRCAERSIPRRLRATGFGLLLAVLLAPALAEAPSALDERSALQAGDAAVGTRVPDYTLLDRQGRPVRLSSYRGKPLLVSFIYTGCFQICPASTRALHEAVKGLDKLLAPNQFNVVSIGFNQPFDSPAAMRAFAAQHGIDYPNWEFLSPPPAIVEALTRDFGFRYVATPAGFDHVLGVTLVDAQGRIHTQVYGERMNAQRIGEPLRQLLTEGAAAAAPATQRRDRTRAHPVHGLRPRDRRVPLRLRADLRDRRRAAVLPERGGVLRLRMAQPPARA